MELMNQALAQARLPENIEQLLRAFFGQTSEFMINQA